MVILMNTIKNEYKQETIINKSRFITSVYKVNTVNDSIDIINNVKKEYKDATHICFAYKIDNIKRFNDDKEPSGTAGMPILNVIEQNDLNHILIVVVRYFGGIKLGSGGLIRAYSSCASDVIKNAEIIKEVNYIKIRIIFDYENVNNVNYILKDYQITYKKYDNNVIYEFIYDENNYPNEIDKYITKKEFL